MYISKTEITKMVDLCVSVRVHCVVCVLILCLLADSIQISAAVSVIDRENTKIPTTRDIAREDTAVEKRDTEHEDKVLEKRDTEHEDKVLDIRHKRFSGGAVASASDYPWQVQMRYFVSLECSGTLISPWWILTAASCFNGNYAASHWSVILSPLNGSNEGTTSVMVDSLYLHGDYNAGEERHNLALVRLHSIDVTRSYAPASLISPLDDVTSADCITAGWASTTEITTALNSFRVLFTPVLDHVTCSQRYNRTVDSDSLCTATRVADSGPCTEGDIGAPLMCRFGDVWKVSGVVSQLYGCTGNINETGLYVNVQNYLGFITKLMSRLTPTDTA